MLLSAVRGRCMATEAATPATIAVEVVRSDGPRDVRVRLLQLPPGTRVADALTAAQIAYSQSDDLGLSLWGRRVGLDQVLREGDRLECLRPLRVDPKYARRERFQAQGSRKAGLFAR